MIVCEKPEIKIEGDSILFFSKFHLQGEVQVLWYKLPLAFRDLIVTENLDASLVGLLFLGLKTGQDIKVKGPVSARLYYTLSHYLLEAICLANPVFKKIRIFPDSLSTKDLNISGSAGTGMSCGVDSFATYFDHIEEEKPFKIDFFTFFNVGSHGDRGGQKARSLFKKRAARIEKFAQDEGVNFIPIDSNLSEILGLNFQETHTLRSVSCVLLLQKLFKYYYYASSIRFDRFKLDDRRIAEYDLLILQMLSTESTNLFSSVSHLTRPERIQLISNYPATHNNLDVCTNSSTGESKINCSVCHKCIRTMLTLDVLGSLNQYKEVFDISDFNENKIKYVGELFFKKKKETLDLELIDLIKRNNYKVTLKSYLYGIRRLYLPRGFYKLEQGT